ncbi:MAG: nucleoside-diphosphate kinase [Patescibacteria group bacterium]|nr:nucleoside-diphosphate kinase [Patescibacteria group bacterium]
MDRTLVMIKPDANVTKIFLNILMIYLANFKIVLAKIVQMDKAMAEEFYKEHTERPFFKELVQQMTSGPTIILVLEGEDVVNRVRKINGATNPANADVGTIRQAFGTPNGGPKNAVHGSDSLKSAAREIAFFFPPDA